MRFKWPWAKLAHDELVDEARRKLTESADYATRTISECEHKSEVLAFEHQQAQASLRLTIGQCALIIHDCKIRLDALPVTQHPRD